MSYDQAGSLTIREVSKSYGTVRALDGVSLEIRRGEIFGLLGPNGAGKTTLMHLVAGLMPPDDGTIRFGDAGDPTSPAVRRNLALVPQQLAIYEDLTAEENIRFFGRMWGIGGADLSRRTETALELAGLADHRSRRAKTYSGGMKRRLNLACGLVHSPNWLLLDEPPAGVDPQSRHYLLERIAALRDENVGIVYTTHYMEEAQRLCDRVAIIDHGRVLDVGTVRQLIDRHGAKAHVRAELEERPPGVELPGTVDGDTLEFFTATPFEDILALWQAGVRWQRLAIQQADLESVFLNLTGRRLRDEAAADAA